MKYLPMRVHKDSLKELMCDLEGLGWAVRSIGLTDQKDVFMLSVQDTPDEDFKAETKTTTVQVSPSALKDLFKRIEKIEQNQQRVRVATFWGMDFLLITYICE